MGILEAATQRMKMEEARYEEQIAALKAENERLNEECRLSMQTIANERNRAERAEAQLVGTRKALVEIIERSHNDPLGTSKVIDMREIARSALDGG